MDGLSTSDLGAEKRRTRLLAEGRGYNDGRRLVGGADRGGAAPTVGRVSDINGRERGIGRLRFDRAETSRLGSLPSWKGGDLFLAYYS
jgi:hypothetical protein